MSAVLALLLSICSVVRILQLKFAISNRRLWRPFACLLAWCVDIYSASHVKAAAKFELLDFPATSLYVQKDTDPDLKCLVFAHAAKSASQYPATIFFVCE